MDLRLPDEAIAFQSEIRAWLAEHLTDDVVEARRSGALGIEEGFDLLRAWNATLVDAGWGAPAWPSAFGGRDATPLQEMVFNAAMAEAGAPGPVNAIGVANIGPAIMAVGTEEQQATHLRPLLRGDTIWCQGMSEPDAGSDLASLRTRAELDGDDFVINGQKIWTSEGHRADWCQLYVRTDQDAPKHKGISCLLVDMRTPGIEPRRIRTMDGDTPFSELWFTDVRVPATALLGELHAGWRVATTTLGFERAGVTKLHAMVQDKLHRLLEELRSVDPDGRRARADPRVRDQLARRVTQVTCLRLLAQRAVATAERGGVPGPEGSLAKLLWSAADQAITTTAVDVLGYQSLAGHWGHQLCSSRSTSIAGGTTEINKSIVAERILGLPREPA